jgi:uncharacterized surface protein with fasciclin (FAS1) repeats
MPMRRRRGLAATSNPRFPAYHFQATALRQPILAGVHPHKEPFMKKLAITLAACALLGACASQGMSTMPAQPMAAENTVMVGGAAMFPSKDIVDNAVNSKDHTTLVAAVKAAGLVDTLKGKGPFTVFAPTDAAFAKVPKADLDALLKDKAKLTAVLTYHVVPGKVMSTDIKPGKVKTVQGSELTLATTGGVMVDKAKVVSADVAADNGVIHVIDTVLMPK